MSQSNTEAHNDEVRGHPPLRDVFQQALAENAGNSPLAFIAALDELDRRMAETAAEIDHNGETFETLTTWYERTDDRLKALPGTLQESVKVGLRDHLQGQMTQIHDQAAKGAYRGSAPVKGAVEALWMVADDYRTRRAILARKAALGLPLAFLAAIVAGALFMSLVVPTLPASWHWPCHVTGLEFRESSDPNTTFCLIQRR